MKAVPAATLALSEYFCSPDIELSIITLCPYYLQSVIIFSVHIIISVHMIPPSGSEEAACDIIYSVTARPLTKYTCAFISLTDHFNHVPLSPALPTFLQSVKCTTGDNKTLDLLNVKDAVSSIALLCAYTIIYKTVVQQQPVAVRMERKCSHSHCEDIMLSFFA